MSYKLTSPCTNCPFRKDIKFYLTNGRVREIISAITNNGGTFDCHKTTGVDGPENIKRQHCAGALIMLEKAGILFSNQMVRIASRLGMFNPDRLDMNAPTFESPEEMILEYRKRNRETGEDE